MNVKYQIFVSSTYEDLKDERNEVIKACLNMGNIPVGMEMFNAADEEQWAVITRTIDQCDYYVVIVAHRYGSTTAEGISFTEKEYDYARDRGIPTLGFVIADDARWPADRMEAEPENRAKLERFKAKVRGKMVKFWSNGTELHAQFVTSLGTTINVRPRRGWIRAPEDGADIAQTLSNLAEENANLRRELEEFRSTRAINDDVREALSALLAKGIDQERFIFLAERLRTGIAESEWPELKILGLIGGNHMWPELTPLGSQVYRRLLTDTPPF